ncbi:MAG: glycosyl hydrolase 115 family protein [Kiritimatiellae bacterium]|nr:glycosyl hydrolase 115 family protein [Kiritimatiellia bacterium]
MKKCNKRAELSGRTLTGTTVFVAIAALCMVAASLPSWAATHGKIVADTGRIADKGVRYRGIFINDEFLGLRPWAVRRFGREEQIGTNAYEEVFALMKRDGLNLLWPAMHPSGNPGAYEYSERPENLEQAKRRGIVIGTSHCEPMLRNNALLSDQDKKKWSWTRCRDWLEAYWREGARRGEDKDVLWTIGMRGICDSGLAEGKTLREKARIMEDVFAAQCAMLPKDAPKLFVPYKEVMNIYNSGLKVPDGVTIMWVNDNFGYVRRLGGPQAAGHGGGIYWHASYHGVPHGYYHVCTTPPAFMWYELVAKCWNNGVRDVWMVNVGDVFQAELLLGAYGKFANAPDAWGADAQERFLSEWTKEFLSCMSNTSDVGRPASDVLAKRISAHLAEYYNLGFNRKPEHMCIQWTTNLPTSVKSDLLRRYHALLKEDTDIESALSENLRDKYFRIVGYQARFLAYAGIIHLEGKDRGYAHAMLDPLTERWDTLEGGKWAGIWYDTIDWTTHNAWDSAMQWPWNEPKNPAKRDYTGPRFLYPATAYRDDVQEPEWLEPVSRERGTGDGEWIRVSGLGTSGNALALLPVKPGVGVGAAVEYALTGSEKVIVLQFLPDFALWPGLKLGVNVSFDGSKPVYVAVPKSDSNIGELDPVRNRAVQDNFIRVEVPVPCGAKSFKIVATDPGVVIDHVGARYNERNLYGKENDMRRAR